MKLWHLTDTHLGRRHGRGPEAIAAVAAQAGPGDLVILTGDITEGGHPSEYDLARELLAPLRGRLVLCPGNHDYSGGVPPAGIAYCDEGRESYRQLARWAGSPQPGTMLAPAGTDLLILPLDSCRWTVSPADLARGHLGPDQLAHLAEGVRVAGQHALHLVIALHHDVVDSDPTMTLEDGGELLALAWPAAALVLSGHTHGPAREWTATEGVRGLWRRGQDAVSGGESAVWGWEG